ncbi:MAG TPA: condensation domain-containing protein, partial [Thermoanaerobaculia bacterium]|nr:condensation domain-containing protein [Thermoanaerobaculia bacterium]
MSDPLHKIVDADAGLDRAALLALPEEERRPALEAWLRAGAAKALGVPSSLLAADRPLTAAGLDSLAAVELRGRVESALGASLPLSGMLEGATLAELAAAVLEGLAPDAPAAAGGPSAGGVETGTFPLSHGQRSLWFLQRLAPESPAWHLAGAGRVRGPLDPGALAWALEALVERHPALRTTFHEGVGGEPFQRVHASLTPEVQIEDAEGWSDGDVESRLRAEVRRPFDLKRGPLVRLGVLRRGGGESVIFLAVHQIVSDGRSLAVIARDLEILYARESGRPVPEPPPLALRYTDWSRWRRERLAGPEGERLWEHWRQALAGDPPRLALPTDRPWPAAPSWEGGARNFRLDGAATAALAALAGGRGGTLFMGLLAVFEALLARVAGQEEILLGTSTDGRCPEVADLVGRFANPVAVRTRLAGDPTFLDILDETRRAVVAAFEHRDYPLPLLGDRLRPRRDPARPPLFDVVFDFEKAGGEGSGLGGFVLGGFLLGETGGRLRLDGLTLESLALPPAGAPYALSFVLARTEEGIGASLRFNAGRFDAATVERLAEQYRSLLAGALAAPGSRLSELPLLARSEAGQTKEPGRKRLSSLSAADLQRLALRIKQGQAGERAIPSVPRDGRPLPLALSQERLWFLDQLQPGSGAYNIPGNARLRGRLDAALLARTLDALVARHEPLRTTFVSRDGRPAQEIRPGARLAMPGIDLSALPEERREAEARSLSGDEAVRPFDLARGPLLRASLLRLGAEDHVLLLTMHHIVSDGWSLRVLMREVGALYAAFAAGRPSPLPPLPVQYADFAAWQRERLHGEALEREIGYWRQRLEGVPALDLPTDRPRRGTQTFHGARRRATLPPELAVSLGALATRRGSSLFMVLLGGFELLMSRLSGQEDFAVGSPVAGRTRKEAEALVGFFLNSLALRADLAGDPPFGELLDRVRETALDAYSHQEVPFEKLLEALRPERSLSRTPLFQVFFNLLNLPKMEASLPGLSLEVFDHFEAEAKFDLTLYVAETDAGVALDLVYNRDLFDGGRMEELLRQYAFLLEQAVAAPEERVGSYSLVTPEAAALLPDPAAALGDEWRGAVHELFRERAAMHPGRVAAAGPGETWTYGELDEASDRIAASLKVAKGDRVAVFAHRSPALVAAVLGVLKAGAAFVMLDPAYPARRLRDILEIAGARAVVRLESAGPCPAALPEIVLPAGGPAAVLAALAALPEGTPEKVALGADDLAYVAFTSGSTGQPKGILGRHGPLSHFLPWQC